CSAALSVLPSFPTRRSSDLSLHLARLFPKPWQYLRAHAQLLWEFDPQGFTLRSPYLQVSGEEGEIGGDFLIRLLADPNEEDYMRSEEHTSELQSRENLVCRL